jgi:hypothetical protein
MTDAFSKRLIWRTAADGRVDEWSVPRLFRITNGKIIARQGSYQTRG